MSIPRERVPIADFDGICSGDIYVFESANPERLLPTLLPFICQTDAFLDHAVGTSAGSLSPRTNWTSLSDYEFALPPLEEQRRIAPILEQTSALQNRHREAGAKAQTTFQSLLESSLGGTLPGQESQWVGPVRYNAKWPIAPLGSIARVERGKFAHRPRNLPEFFGGQYPFIQVGDIAASVGRLRPASEHLSDLGVKYSRSFPPGTVLISITGAVLAKTAIACEEVWTPDSIVGVLPSQGFLPEFIEYLLRRLFPLFNGSLATKSTTQKNINLETLRPLRVPCPPESVQKSIVSDLDAIQAAVGAHENRARDVRSVADALVSQFLGERQAA